MSEWLRIDGVGSDMPLGDSEVDRQIKAHVPAKPRNALVRSPRPTDEELLAIAIAKALGLPVPPSLRTKVEQFDKGAQRVDITA